MLIDARDLCWFLAGILSAVAGVVVLKPAWTKFKAGGKSTALRKPSVMVAALIVVLAIVLFVWLMSRSPQTGAVDGAVSAQASAGTPPGSSSPSAGSMDASLTRLESRLHYCRGLVFVGIGVPGGPGAGSGSGSQ